MVFYDDPKKHHRSEDSQLAWSMKRYLDDPAHNPEEMILMPMAKASLQIMKAVTEYTRQE